MDEGDRTFRVAVVQGGPSTEAEVSRRSAAGVGRALASRGHRVSTLELDADLPAALREVQPEVVFPAVHGAIGEDGSLQGLLEVLNLPYVGSGVLASALATDKIFAKRMFVRAGLPVAREAHVHRGEPLGAAAARVRAALGPAVVVKPHAQGSAIGVSRVPAEASDDELSRALQAALEVDEIALCERFVVGKEITCGVLDAPTFGEPRAFPPTEMRAKLGSFYDFRSRYAQGGSEHFCPAPLPDPVLRRIQDIALGAHRALGCRDLSRADFVVGDGEDPDAVTLLEVNTLPGMTPTSLYPEAAAVVGISMEALCDGLARAARARGGDRKVAIAKLP